MADMANAMPLLTQAWQSPHCRSVNIF